MTDTPTEPYPPALRDAIAAALSTAARDQPCTCGTTDWSSCVHPGAPSHEERRADAVLAVVQPALDELADYRNRTAWETTCGEHARLLDACRAADERADRAEAALAQSRQAAFERADLLEEARDALSAAGQNGPHSDDWPQIAPGIRALAERADKAQQEQRQAEAVTEVWRANAELAAGQRDQARAAIARVRVQCAEWARPIKSGSWDAQIRDDIAASCADMILYALDGPAVDEIGAVRAPVVHPGAEQPVSTPQEADDSDADACRIVHVDAGGPMSPQSAAHFAEVIRAARLRDQAEHPEDQAGTTPPATEQPAAVTAPPTWPPSTLFRRLVNGLSGAVYDKSGRPICTCTVGGQRCATCRTTHPDGG